MKKLLWLLLLTISVVPVSAQEPFVTLGGVSYQFRPHPRLDFNATNYARSCSASGPAPKAVITNVPYNGMIAQANYILATYPYTNLNNANEFQDGQVAALMADAWCSNETGTNAASYLAFAQYLLLHMNQFVGFPCNESINSCVNTSYGDDHTAYGMTYWIRRWMHAYEQIRPTFTTTQQQTFADMGLNDISVPAGTAWCPVGSPTNCGGTGLGGSPNTSCTNPTIVTTLTITFSGGNMTASAPFFGSGQIAQQGDMIWVPTTGSAVGLIASVTDSTHAAIESDKAAAFGSYSGTVIYYPQTWTNGNCGWLWAAKHYRYHPYSVIQSKTAYPSSNPGPPANPGYGGEDAGGVQTAGYTDNLAIAGFGGDMAAFISLADDDVNFSVRTSPQITALHDAWKRYVFLNLYEANYTPFNPTGEAYSIWTVWSNYTVPAYEIANSFVSAPNYQGLWSSKIAEHFYGTTFPSCPSQEFMWGTSYAQSSYNSFMPNEFGMPMLTEWYQGTPNGEYLNYWMQNLWSRCTGVTGTIWNSLPKWNATGMAQNTTGGIPGAGNSSQNYWYIWWDSLFASNSALPTTFAENTSDAGSAATPMAGLVSRTGYNTMLDTLFRQTALYVIPGIIDHSNTTGGFQTGDYTIFKGSWLFADDSNAGGYNGGGPFGNGMTVGGDSNATPTSKLPFIIKMPLAHGDANYGYAMVDCTLSFVSTVGVTGCFRSSIHFKSSSQDVIHVRDYVITSSGQLKQIYLQYPQGAVNPPISGGTTVFSSPNVTSTYPGITSISNQDAAQLFTTILSPDSSHPVYAYTQNSNGTYTGGFGYTFRVSLCNATSAAPTTCDTSNTTGQFAVVHVPMAGTGNTRPPSNLLTTIDSNHIGIETDTVGQTYISIMPNGGSPWSSASFTTNAFSGTGFIVVAGLSPGVYNITSPSGPPNCTVISGDGTCSFRSTEGVMLITTGTSYTLSVSTGGSGSGTVTGSSCAGTYASGAPYSCIATANSGSVFSNFSGSTCGGSASSNVYSGNMPSLNCTVTANFSKATPSIYETGIITTGIEE